MTKKHYEAIAEDIRTNVRTYANATNRAEKVEVLRRVAISLANTFAIDNPRFDRSRFLNACEVPMPCVECGAECSHRSGVNMCPQCTGKWVRK